MPAADPCARAMRAESEARGVGGGGLIAAVAASPIQEPFQGEELKNLLDHVSLK